MGQVTRKQIQERKSYEDVQSRVSSHAWPEHEIKQSKPAGTGVREMSPQFSGNSCSRRRPTAGLRSR